jgi:hypothetical protein
MGGPHFLKIGPPLLLKSKDNNRGFQPANRELKNIWWFKTANRG